MTRTTLLAFAPLFFTFAGVAASRVLLYLQPVHPSISPWVHSR